MYRTFGPLNGPGGLIFWDAHAPQQRHVHMSRGLRGHVPRNTVMYSTMNEGEMPEYLRRVKVQMPQHRTEGLPDGKAKFKFLPAKDVRRALGVDYGRKHIGVAVSTMGWAPRPLQFIRGGGIVELMRMAQDVVDVAMEEQCDAIIVGLPVTHQGSLYKRASDSQQGRRCRNFAHTVLALSDKHSIGVFLVDERGTSQEAGALLDIVGTGQRRKGRKDSVAAALILSTFFADPGAALRVRLRNR